MNRRWIVWALPAVVLAAGAGCTRVKPDEIGVRTVNFGTGKGIVDQDYGPGYHRYLWPLDTWHRFPSTVQELRFARDSAGAWSEQGEPLQITSSDGDHVLMNAEVLFKVDEGNAHLLLQDSGSDDRYKDLVRGLAQDAARVQFGGLHTEAFYNEATREDARKATLQFLKQRLDERHIALIDFLLESIEFDPNYENLIRQKKIADQQVELEKAKSRAAEEQGKVNKIKAEAQVQVRKIERETAAQMTHKTTEIDLEIGTLKAEADKYAQQLIADAGLYKSQHEADGQKLMKESEAEGKQRMNEALIGEGGRNLVALEAVKNLNMAEVVFPSAGYNWFNPSDVAVRLGAVGGDAVTSSVAKPQR